MKKNMLYKSNNEVDNYIKKVGIIILIMVILLGLTYLFTNIVLNKDDNNENRVTESGIQYDEILVGESFNMKQDEYYVIYFDKNDSYSSVSSLISSYQLNDDGKIKLYSADLSNVFNKKYVSDSIETNDINNFKIKVNTLIKFNQGNVDEVITDLDEIISILNG